MAEIFLLSTLTEAVVSHTIERISDLLMNEAPALSVVRDEVEVLRGHLRRIHSFLRSPCGQHQDLVRDDRVRNWVSEIRDLACEIEDVIEIFIVRSDSSVFKPFLLRSLRRRMNAIKSKLESCYESRRIFGIPVGGDPGAALFSPGVAQAQLRRSYPDEDEDEDEEDGAVVGQDECVEALKARLMQEKEWLCAVPVLGMGGLGKTAVAKKAYNDRDVKRRFDCRAWVLISQEYVAREVFAEILMQIGFSPPRYVVDPDEAREEIKREWERLKAMEESELIRAVKNKLRGKRYLVVFDDVWRVEDFDSIRRIFPKERRGSKVVFTTRMREVASSVDPGGSPIQPPLLGPEESWALLHRKAFPSDVFGERLCPPEFERMGREMVKRCGGLPLAIVVLGGLLRTKNSEDEWRKVERNVNSHISRQKSGVGQMLALSYHDLPYYLKPCFLYLGSFPEDWEIPRRQLIQLWIAEGLVIEPSTSRGQVLEEIAEQYLRELINRCMVEVGSRGYTGDGVKTCRVHHLMRDFCVSKARRDGFSEVVQRHEVKNLATIEHCKARRIAVHPGCDLHPRQTHPNLRSLMYFEAGSPARLQQFLRSKNLRLLRVLEFGFDRGTTRKCNVPAEIGGLIHLRYLGLRGGGRVRLPSTVESLRSLTTVNLRDNDEVVLPVEIFRLKRLKHLLLPSGSSYPHGFTWLTYALSDTAQIQTLKHIRFGPFLLKNKLVQSELRSLRNLGVEFESGHEAAMLLASPNFELGLLHSLHMSLLSRVGFSGLQPLSRCAVLSKLCLDGRLFGDCHRLDFLPESLTKLILQGSGIRDRDPMAALERLPNLRFLRLEDAFAGPRMACGAGGFPRLETLLLLSMEEVTEWEMVENSMPNLKRVYIKHMPNMKIPKGLKNIPSFKELIHDD